MDNWFSTQVDRDFQTGMYGDGIRLYDNPEHYIIIKGVLYDKEKNILVVKNDKGHNIKLSKEPNVDYFKNTLLTYWRNWNNSVGKHYEDRCDYKPWAHTSLKSLAAELGLHSNVLVNEMYIK